MREETIRRQLEAARAKAAAHDPARYSSGPGQAGPVGREEPGAVARQDAGGRAGGAAARGVCGVPRARHARLRAGGQVARTATRPLFAIMVSR